MSKSENSKRFGIRLVLLFAAVGIAVGVVGGLLLSRSGADKQTIVAAGADESEQWYTCGMHPHVIQQGTVKCPICQMKLTSWRAGQDQ